MEPDRIHHLLLTCLQKNSDKLAQMNFKELSKLDWDNLLKIANRLKVDPLLHDKFKQLNFQNIPEKVKQDLQIVVQSNTLRNLRLYGELKQILQAFKLGEIPVIVLKGAYLAPTIYSEISLRKMGDIDLLVPQNTLKKASEQLLALGYQPIRSHIISIETQQESEIHLPPFLKSDPLPLIDLHWDISSLVDRYNFEIDRFWERARKITLFGADALAFAPEDLLLHLAHHAAYKHQFEFDLRAFCDIARAIDYFASKIRWDELVKRAIAYQWNKGIYLAFYLAKDLVDAAIPIEVLVALKPNNIEASIIVTAREQLFCDYEIAKLLKNPVNQLFYSEKPLRHKIKSFLQRLFVFCLEIASSCQISTRPPKIYFNYSIRFKMLLVRYAHTIRRLFSPVDEETESVLQRKKQLENWLFNE